MRAEFQFHTRFPCKQIRANNKSRAKADDAAIVLWPTGRELISAPTPGSADGSVFCPRHCFVPRLGVISARMSRLDQVLVERGLCDSRERAKRLILAGQVRINGHPARKPSDAVKPADALTLDAPEKFVSRGGHKLDHALEHFQLNVAGLTAIDLGASTGGFTDCLLQRGAATVFAVDVGQGQLAWKLRQDPRVVVMEKTNARFLRPEHFKEQAKKHSTSNIQPRNPKAAAPPAPASALGVECSMLNISAPPPADLVVVDCSFISLKKILPPAAPLVKPGGRIVALIKPQFEAGKEEADKGRGVITDSAVHERVLNELREFVAAQAGLCWRGVVESPLLGPAGNKEFLTLIEKVR
jgi:23S rRNA (cytidine1920-2'-O)/16S rRNA (cytidine1409-2'-O)-methyltransferase